MKKKNHLMMAAAALLTMAACTNENEVNLTGSPVEARITAGMGNNATTRADGTTWEADVIGVRVAGAENEFGIDETDNPRFPNYYGRYTNIPYETTSTAVGSAEFTAQGAPIVLTPLAKNWTLSFSAYGPYSSTVAEDNLITNSTASQNTRELQKAVDYIYASGAKASFSSPDVAFTGTDYGFYHKMAKLVIKVTVSTDFSDEEVAAMTPAFSLTNIWHNGTFNISTGTAEATGDATTEWSLCDNSVEEISTDKRTYTYTSILYPQSLSPKLYFDADLTINGRMYGSGTSFGSDALAAGTVYEYAFNLTKTTLTLSGAEVNDWTPGETNSTDVPLGDNGSV